jgi:hypothetical protein
MPIKVKKVAKKSKQSQSQTVIVNIQKGKRSASKQPAGPTTSQILQQQMIEALSHRREPQSNLSPLVASTAITSQLLQPIQQSLAQLIARQPQAQHINIAPPSVNVAPPSVNIAPAPINIAPPNVNVHPPNINIAPPNVNVHPPNINIAPAPINIVPPNINIAPPNVNVAPPHIDIKPAPINIKPAPINIRHGDTVINLPDAPLVQPPAPLVPAGPQRLDNPHEDAPIPENLQLSEEEEEEEAIERASIASISNVPISSSSSSSSASASSSSSSSDEMKTEYESPYQFILDNTVESKKGKSSKPTIRNLAKSLRITVSQGLVKNDIARLISERYSKKEIEAVINQIKQAVGR